MEDISHAVTAVKEVKGQCDDVGIFADAKTVMETLSNAKQQQLAQKTTDNCFVVNISTLELQAMSKQTCWQNKGPKVNNPITLSVRQRRSKLPKP